jgi:hypothetical protein
MRFLFVLAILALSPLAGAFANNDQKDVADSVSLRKDIFMAQDWLVNFQKDNGLYHYVFRPWGNDNAAPVEDPLLDDNGNPRTFAPGAYVPTQDDQAVYPDDDNIVRQILSYWALIKSTDFRKTDAIMNSIAEFERGLAPYIVIEDSEYGKALFVHFNDMKKVNSTALYLSSLLSKKDRNMPLTEEQENHIHYAVNGLKVFAAPEAGFYYHHGSDEINFITSYGSGEAQLALAQYINRYGDEELYEWTHKRFDEYFNQYYKDSFSSPMSYMDKERIGYHTWALYYLQEIDKYKPIDYEKYVRPLVQFSFDFKAVNELCMDNPCIYSMAMWDSSSVEGLGAAYTLMQKYETDEAFMKQTENYLHNAVHYLMSLQIDSVGEYEHKTGQKFRNNPKHLIGGFCDWPHCQYLRNEVTMHVAAALMQYHHIFHR